MSYTFFIRLPWDMKRPSTGSSNVKGWQYSTWFEVYLKEEGKDIWSFLFDEFLDCNSINEDKLANIIK